MLRDGEEFSKLLGYVRENSGSLSEGQLKILLGNLSRIVHQTVEKSRSLKGINVDNYDETKAKGKDFDMTELRTSILKQYLILCRNTIHLAETIRSQHPEMSDKIDDEENVYIGSYYHELSQGTSLPSDYAEKVVARYKRTGNPILARIANQIERIKH